METEISDFAHDPTTNTVAAFIAAPVFREGVLGIVAVQLNNAELSTAVNDYTGLGATGETVAGSHRGNEVVVVTSLRHDPDAAFRRTATIGQAQGLPLQRAGFAVVAREIRRLADQTTVATLDIEHMIQEMASAVSAGVTGMEQFAQEVHQRAEEVRTVGTQLTHIITQVQALAPRFDSVHEGMQAQAEGAQQISEAMGQLNEVAQQTSSALHASPQVIKQLQTVSQDLHQEIYRFHVEA